MRKTIVRLLFIAGLCGAASLTTMLARRPPAARAAQAVSPAPATATTTTGQVTRTDPATALTAEDSVRNLEANPSIKAYSLVGARRLDVAVDGSRANISASLQLFAKGKLWSFIWALEIRDANKNVAWEHLYRDQEFRMPPGRKEHMLTIAESVTLAPGTYTATVMLYVRWPGQPAYPIDGQLRPGGPATPCNILRKQFVVGP